MNLSNLKVLPKQPGDLYERVDLDDYRQKVQEATRFSFQKTIDSATDALIHLFSKKPPKQNLSKEIKQVFRQNHPIVKSIPTLDHLRKIASSSQESFTEIENAACEVRIQLAADLYKQTHSQQALKHQMRTEWFIVQELNDDARFKTLSSTEKQLIAKAIMEDFPIEKRHAAQDALTSGLAILRQIDESSSFEDLYIAKLILRSFPELEEELDERTVELLSDISSEEIADRIKTYVQSQINLHPETYNFSIDDNTDSALRADADRSAYALEYQGKRLLLSKETLKETESIIQEIVRKHCPLGVGRYDKSLEKAFSSTQANSEMTLRAQSRLKQDPTLDLESVKNAVLDEEISLLDQKQLRTILQGLLSQGGLNPVTGFLASLFAVEESDFYLGDYNMLLYIQNYAQNPVFRTLSETDEGGLRLSFLWEGYLKPGIEYDNFCNLNPPLSRKGESLALQHTRYSTIRAEYTFAIDRDLDGEWKVSSTLDDLSLDFKTPFPNTLYDLIDLPQDPSSTHRNGIALHFLTYSPQLLDFKTEESLFHAMKGIPNTTPSERAEAASCVWHLLNDPTEQKKAKECCNLFASLHSNGLKQLRTAFTVATEMKLEQASFQQFTHEQQLIASHLFIRDYPSGSWDYVDSALLKKILSSNLNTPDFRYQAALLFSVFSDLCIDSPPPLLELKKNHRDLGLSLKRKMFQPEKGLTSAPEALRINLEDYGNSFYKEKRKTDEEGRKLLNLEIDWDEEISDLIDQLTDENDPNLGAKASSLRALLNLALSKSTAEGDLHPTTSQREHHPGGLDPVFSLATALSTWFPHEELETLFLRLLDSKSPLEIAFQRTQSQDGTASLHIEYRYQGYIVPFADGTTPEDFSSLTDEEEKRLFRHPRYIPISMNYSIELQETDSGWICPNPPRIEPPILFSC